MKNFISIEASENVPEKSEVPSHDAETKEITAAEDKVIDIEPEKSPAVSPASSPEPEEEKPNTPSPKPGTPEPKGQKTPPTAPGTPEKSATRALSPKPGTPEPVTARAASPKPGTPSSAAKSKKELELEEYKNKLAEKRRQAREKAEREAEIERQRQEQLRWAFVVVICKFFILCEYMFFIPRFGFFCIKSPEYEIAITNFFLKFPMGQNRLKNKSEILKYIRVASHDFSWKLIPSV